MDCLKVMSTKQSQCDTFPTSNMELFMVIGIFRVIFCKLMILYRQYCPECVFYVSARYWFYSVPGGFTCRYLRWCSLWVQLLLVLYYIGQQLLQLSFSYRFLITCVSFLLNPSRSRWFQLIPACSRWFQLVPCFSMYVQY